MVNVDSTLFTDKYEYATSCIAIMLAVLCGLNCNEVYVHGTF